MVKQLMLAIFLVFIFQSSWAGKIYRWTDSQGNVHFSSTPGPNQSADAQMGSANKASQRSDYSAEDIFTGNWYGSSRTLTVKLFFLKKSNVLRWEGRPRGGGIKAEHFTAKWKYVNSDLELIYTSYKEDASKAGTTEVIKIIEKSADSLMLQFPNGKVFKLHKKGGHKRLSQAEKKIIGKWELKDNKKTQWKMTSRAFEIRGVPPQRRDQYTLASGNWKVEGDTLILTHLNNRESWHKTHKTGDIERFTILLQEQGKLIIKPVNGGGDLVLHRQR